MYDVVLRAALAFLALMVNFASWPRDRGSFASKRFNLIIKGFMSVKVPLSQARFTKHSTAESYTIIGSIKRSHFCMP